MNFLYPGFLFALLTVAIPVIIHLFNFRKFKKVYFSNVAFLKEVKEQHSSREKLKSLLILCARILAIVFMVFAFARPFIPSTHQVDPHKGNVVSIYIDNSYSMESVNKEGSLLDEAKRKAKEIVKAYQLNDRFQLLTNNFEGKHQRLLNGEELIQAIDEVKVSSATRPLQQVINRQQRIFSGLSNRFIYIISDFQQNFVGNLPITADPQTNVSLVKLNANSIPNVAVDSVWMLSPVHQPNATEKLVVQLKNYGDEEAQNIPLKLTINNQQKAISSLTVPAGGMRKDTLSFSKLQVGWQEAIITIKDFPLTFDDQLNFSFRVNTNQQVLSINGSGAGPYMKALFEVDPYFQLTEMPEANINYVAIQKYSLVVLNGLVSPSSGLATTIKQYVANGGSVVVFPNLDSDLRVYSSFLTAIQLPAVAGLQQQPAQVNHIELKNPLFKEVFESLPQQLDLPQAQRYLTFTEQQRKSQQNLLELSGNKLFFSRFPIGNGQIYLAATALRDEDSNLAKHPVFVPLMYKIAFASTKEYPIYYTAMHDNVIETEKIDLGGNQSLKLVADNFEVIPELRQTNGKTLVYVADQVKRAGFYALKKADSTIALIAFNDNRAESAMSYAEPAELKKIFTKNQRVSVVDPRTDRIDSLAGTKNNGTELWKVCLILTLIFLAIEILLVRFYHIHKK